MLIWFFLKIATKKAPTDHLPKDKGPSAAILAKEHNRRLRQEKEELEVKELLEMSKGQKGSKQKADNVPSWFIGSWGIKEPSHAEQLIINELRKYNVKWYREVSFTDLISPTGGFPRYDFYIPRYQVAIEYQGQGYHESEERKASDKLKAKYCKDNNICLYIYEVEQYRNMEKTIADLMRSLSISPKNSL